jgi:hypothetical protein
LSTTAGDVTTTAPVSPDHAVFIGIVTRAQNGNGRILYRIQNGFELGELHDVLLDTPPTDGDVLTYDSVTGLWKNEAGVSTNIYNSDGTIDANRTVDLDGNTLRFSNGIVEFDQGTNNSGEIKLYEDTDFGSNKVILRAPQALASDVTFFFPPNNGTNGYVLTTNGSGATSWAAAAGGLSAIPQTDVIYVDSVLGADNADAGRGNIEKPYATVEYVLANTTNTGTVTGNTTSGSAIITSVSSTTNIKVGQYITGTNIPYNSIVVSKTSNTIVLSKTATGTGSTITITWWTPKTIRINGDIVATSNWFKPAFWFDSPNANVTWGNFSLFSRASSCLVPEKILLGNLYGNHTSSQFISTSSSSSHDIFIDLNTYYSLGTGNQFEANQFTAGIFNNVYLKCNNFDARFGGLGYLRASYSTYITGNYYGLLLGFSDIVGLKLNGSIETPSSIFALALSYGYNEINGTIKGSFKSNYTGGLTGLSVNGNLIGTTVSLGAAAQYAQGCNINGDIECTTLNISQNYNTNINGRVKGSIVHDSGQLNIQKFYGGTYTGSGSATTAYITGYINSGNNDRYGNLTLSSGAKLYWTSSGNDYSVTGGYIFAAISIASTCTLFVQGKLMGEITSLAGTIQIDSSGYLWIIKKTAAITGSLLNYGEMGILIQLNQLQLLQQ